MRIEVEEALAEGDLVAVRCLVTGSHRNHACPRAAGRSASPACASCACATASWWRGGTTSTSRRCSRR
jgi:hypothetical protein